ncbi:MAG TPA: efflux RND transporter periplasmic adaptor subunit [Casimicrobiaceae bacterium]|nr:efflux RND transporter periplasmic adaptor subunit [Casimicrobiaceae bacterium]
MQARFLRTLAIVALGLAISTADAAASDAEPLVLQTAAVVSGASEAGAGYDGVVQAVRQTVLAARVSGAVVALEVKAGDTVKAGQVLLRLDSRSAEQAAAASAAQVRAAQATREAATRDYARQKQLFEKRYISQAALDRIEEQYKAATAQAAAQMATAMAAQTESGFYTVRAPYPGVVSDVPVVLGDMAMPGRPLLTLYDPTAMRVSVAIPHTVISQASKFDGVQIELPGFVPARVTPAGAQLLPAVDAATHTQELRLDLPSNLLQVRPGSFARVWLAPTHAPARLSVPASAVVRRAEVTAVYVVLEDGRPLLRQVRLGAAAGDRVEVLSGLSAGERVALDPQAAARIS